MIAWSGRGGGNLRRYAHALEAVCCHSSSIGWGLTSRTLGLSPCLIREVPIILIPTDVPHRKIIRRDPIQRVVVTLKLLGREGAFRAPHPAAPPLGLRYNSTASHSLLYSLDPFACCCE